MNYTSIADLANTIRRNLWKIPQDVALIVGVPRSGLMAALILGEMLHKPIQSLWEFIEGWTPCAGGRGKHLHRISGRTLVLDDTCYSGRTMQKVQHQLLTAGVEGVLYGCIYAEGANAKQYVDIWLEDNYNPREELWHLYEWNILHHGAKLSTCTMWDLDGVLCKEPPNEQDVTAYEQYIANAIPMIQPTTRLGAICTYRREQYRETTEQWLRSVGVTYERLIMRTNKAARSIDDAIRYKAIYYGDATWARLFVESSARQAKAIHEITHKQVYCYENGIMYGN